MEIFLGWVIFSILVGVYAGNKGRSGVGFFFLSLLLSPLIGFIVAAVSSTNQNSVVERSDLKKCPACAEYVQREAQVCRFCRYQFAPVSTASQFAQEPSNAPVTSTTGEPQLGSGLANCLKWCERNPIWIFGLFIAVVVAAIVWGTTKQSYEQPTASISAATADASSTPRAQPRGNNSEAVSFARDMTSLNQATWPKAQAVWELDLTPEQLRSDILSYRRSVTHCSATITMSDEWLLKSERVQRDYIKANLDVLHRAPALLNESLDYYPHSSGQIVIKVGTRVVARGTYTPFKTGPITLEPETYVQDKPIQDKPTSQHTAEVTIVRHDGFVSFQGTTDLADSESILFSLSGQGYAGQTKATVAGGKFSTENFTNEGSSLAPGAYSLGLNVFNPVTGLMIAGRRNFELPTTKTLRVSFKPVNLR